MKILFVCEYNACRSQMAEGLARSLLPKTCSIHSAGLYPGKLNELTVEIMKEIGIDISGQRSKQLSEIQIVSFDHVFVLAEPALPHVEPVRAGERHLWVFEDPVALPGEAKYIKEKVRRVRDELKERIEHFVEDHSK